MIKDGVIPPPLPLLITGVAGVTGYNALQYFTAKYPGRIVGIRQQDNENVAGEHVIACDAEDRVGLARLFDQFRFAAVLNCAGNCALRACELDTRLAWRTNVEGLTNLLSFVVERDVRLVHLSIDLVFDDLAGGGFVEDDRPSPVTVYGKTMVAAEQLILDWAPQTCILRISLPMGVSPSGHAGAIDWIQSRFKKSKPATLYYDEVRTPTYTDCLNVLCETVLAHDLSGIYHAGGPRRLSLYQIGQIINRVGGYDPDLLMGCNRSAAGPIPPRAGNVSMDSSRLLEAISTVRLAPWPADESLVPTHRLWHYDRPSVPGTPAWLLDALCRNLSCRAGYPDGVI